MKTAASRYLDALDKTVIERRDAVRQAISEGQPWDSMYEDLISEAEARKIPLQKISEAIRSDTIEILIQLQLATGMTVNEIMQEAYELDLDQYSKPTTKN